MKQFLLTLAVLICSFTTLAQYTTTHIVYFAVDSYTISESEKKALDVFLAEERMRDHIGKVTIAGHTDSDASLEYNTQLSQNRVIAVARICAGIAPPDQISLNWLGETQPLNQNASSDEKRMNRRVEIVVEHGVPDLVETTGTIKDLYKKLEQKEQVFCISPKGDTTLRLEQGTIVYFPAMAFGDRSDDCIEIRAKEFYKKSDMILENLSTASNGRLLESAGMIYLEARSNGQPIELAPNKEALIFLPTETLRPDMQGFNGTRDPHTDNMNWEAMGRPAFLLNIPPGDPCRDRDLDQQPCTRCKFFFCRVKRFGLGMKGIVNLKQHLANRDLRICQRNLRKMGLNSMPLTTPPLTDQQLIQCAQLDSLYKAYGVDNYNALLEAMNKEKMKKYGVKTLEQLHDTLNKIRIAEIEGKLQAGEISSVSQEEMRFYLLSTTRMGWINCDAFTNIEGDKITMETDLKSDNQTDCKAVFTSIRSILPAIPTDKNFQFLKVPKKQEIWLIGLRFKDGQAYLSLTQTTSAAKVVMAQFKPVTLEELKATLRKLD
jgi:hypothetical protein